MKTVTVEKARLLQTLKANQKTHVADFEIAWEKYHDAVISNAEALLKRAKKMKKQQPVDLYIGLTSPQNHADDYDTAINMLDWEQGDSVELTHAEFQQFVEDEWGWKGAFTSSNQYYTGSASPSSVR